MSDAGTHRLLVVDDDPQIRDMLRDYLQDEGFAVIEADSAEAMASALDSTTFDLILLDLILPDADGLSAARELRKTSDVGIIIITGKDEPIDRVVGLELGADDYVTKPFHLRELLARVRSVLRRRTQLATAVPAQSGGSRVATFNGWTLDLGARRLFSPAPERAEVELGSIEFRLLDMFVKRPNEVLSREEIVRALYNREWQPFDRSIDVQMGRLRKKIELDVRQPDMLRTVRGEGYMFAANVAWSAEVEA